jgi:hypothetical protein
MLVLSFFFSFPLFWSEYWISLGARALLQKRKKKGNGRGATEQRFVQVRVARFAQLGVGGFLELDSI